MVDVAVPWEGRVGSKEMEKVDKNQDLALELRKLWGVKVKVVPIVIGALGIVSNDLRHWLAVLEIDIRTSLLQKAQLLGQLTSCGGFLASQAARCSSSKEH